MEIKIKQRITQIQQGEIPEEYKKTESLIIPKNWCECLLGDVVNIFRGASPRPKGDPRYYGGSIPRLLIEDLTRDGKYAIPRIDFLTEEGAKKSRLLPKDSLVMSCSGTKVGIIGFLGVDACIHDGFFGFNNFKNVNSEYLYQYFQLFSDVLQSSATQGGVFNNLTTNIMKNMKCCLPPVEEQNRVVIILDTQDKVIELKEKLLSEKQQQKKYLMQQLLTGKKRLPGFFEKWDKKSFNDVFVFGSTNTFSREQMSEENLSVQNIHYGDILTKYGEILKVSEEKVPSLVEEAGAKITSFVVDGDIIIADTAEDITAGKAVEIQGVGERKIAAGLHTMLCKPKKKWFALGWLGYYMNSEYYHRQLIPYITGIKVMSISKGNIVKTHILVPCVEEQAAIVNILSTADHEIRLLQQNIEQEKQKKKALMQLLLTGIVRAYNE